LRTPCSDLRREASGTEGSNPPPSSGEGTAVGTSAGLLAPYVMGSVVETAASPLDGFNTGFMICGVIMLVGGVIGMMLMRPERETMRWASKMPEVAVGPG
jgi:MFS transporter, ACS family, D-galactonate transporter